MEKGENSLAPPAQLGGDVQVSFKRCVGSAEDLVFFTNTDESDYPIYITPDREVWLKKRPESAVLSLHVLVNTRRYKDVFGSWSFDSESEFVVLAGELRVQPDQRVLEAARALLGLGGDSIGRHLSVFDVKYEVYAGDFERLIGTFDAVVVKLTAESRFYCTEKQAWAISFEWEKRIKAKHPELAKYVYAKAVIGKRCYARVVIKIPFAPKELDEVLAKSMVTQVSLTSELEEQVRVLEEQIRMKERELQALREQLQLAQFKLQLEQMKRRVA